MEYIEISLMSTSKTSVKNLKKTQHKDSSCYMHLAPIVKNTIHFSPGEKNEYHKIRYNWPDFDEIMKLYN